MRGTPVHQFNLADIVESVAAAVPERIALTYEGRHFTYAELDELADKTANLLTRAGIEPGEHVSLFLKNSVEHVTAILGLIKIRAVPINVNYRYTPPELEYIFTDSDSSAVVVELPEHQRTLAELLERCPQVRTVLVVGETVPVLQSAADARGLGVVSFDDAATAPALPQRPERPGHDPYSRSTGGTTGPPKGGVGRHDDFFHKPLSGGHPYGGGKRRDLAEVAAAAKEFPGMAFLIAAPLMHGAAL